MFKYAPLVILLCAGCASNIGRAFSNAFVGTPEEVVSAVKFVDKRMGMELREKYAAIESSPVTNPDGSINHLAAENRFRDMADLNIEIERWEALSEALADYLGVDLDQPVDASIKKADAKRKELWEALFKSAKDLKEKMKDGSDSEEDL